MGASATERNVSFVINVGDNFYYIGVSDLNDSQWKDDFENVYTDPSLNVPWYSILGNHDYGENPECQAHYVSPPATANRWVLPDRNYTKRMLLGAGVYATWVFIDTSPCIAEYRSNDPSGWDPPASEAPEFHPNIIAENCTAQYLWLQQTLATVPSTDWLFVVGHHPADEIDVEDMTTLMQNAKMDLYLCGHSHLLELFHVDNFTTPYVISGAGCMVQVPATEGGHKEELSHHELNGGQGALGHTYKNVWSSKTAGFTIHTFSSDFLSLKTEFIAYNGTTLYSFQTVKQ